MTFEEAREAAELIHYAVILAVVAAIILYKPTLQRVVYRSYLVFGVWVSLVYLTNGCPLTHLENFISLHIYGRQFYPNYEFSDSDVFALLSRNRDLVLPALLVLIFLQWQSKERRHLLLRKSRQDRYSR